MNNRRFLPIIIISFVVLFVVILLSSSLFLTIRQGERGIIFDRFSGLKKDNIFNPGFHVKAPWNDMIVYDVTESKIEETMDVLDKSGLSIKVDVSVRFHPIYDRVGYLEEIFRGDYINRLLLIREEKGNVVSNRNKSWAKHKIQTLCLPFSSRNNGRRFIWPPAF